MSKSFDFAQDHEFLGKTEPLSLSSRETIIEAGIIMPIREYQAKTLTQGCAVCRQPFEQFERMNQLPLAKCPRCGAPVARLISAPAIGGSRSGFDDRAKTAGFHKLKKLGRGEYEKQY